MGPGSQQKVGRGCIHASSNWNEQRLPLPAVASVSSFLPRSLYFPPVFPGNLVCPNRLSKLLWSWPLQTHLRRWFESRHP